MKALPGTMALALMLAAGCMDTTRVNTDCRWSEGPPRPLDLGGATDRNHLRIDVKVAGEIALRTGDLHYRSSPTMSWPIIERCRAALYDSIAQRHAVTHAAIARAENDRVWWVDFLLVHLPIGALVVLAMDRVTRRVCASFDHEGRWLAITGIVILTPVVAAIGVATAQVWSFGIESLLLRSGHVSFRAFQIPVMIHGWLAFFVSLSLAAAAAARRFKTTPLTGVADSYSAHRTFLRPQ